MAHTTDTGVVVIAVAASSILQNFKVWIAFRHGNELRYIPCHRIPNMHLADFSFSTLCQDVILFQHFVGLERKQLGLFGPVWFT